MLKNIQLHISSDEELQSSLEHNAANKVKENQKRNLQAFKRLMPNVYKVLCNATNSSESIYINREGEIDIIDYSNGRVFYGEHVQASVVNHLVNFAKHPLCVHRYNSPQDGLTPDSELFLGLNEPEVERLRSAQPLPKKIPVCVVFGVGLAHHIPWLLEQYDIENLIIYEPNLEYIKCSLATTNWYSAFELAADKGTAVYLQLENDGRTLCEDLSELNANVPFETVVIYKHYQHHMFTKICQEMASSTLDEMGKKCFDSKRTVSFDDYLVPWPPQVSPKVWSSDRLPLSRFERNIAAFGKYFPSIKKEFENYTPQKWLCVADTDESVNLIHKASLTSLYSDLPEADSIKSVDAFRERPNRDGLVLSYSGRKLKRYIHYQLVNKTQRVLNRIHETVGQLPDTVKSMIIFGMGAGYQLEKLYEKHNIEKLFICEPNRDYFYASLFTIDWESILNDVDTQGHRIYINIGDDGTNLIRDLLSQFHSIGPSVLANTYFYQGYYNEVLAGAVSRLREELQVIIAMGDYFDHSRYCIAHTKWSIQAGLGYLRSGTEKLLSHSQKDVPVFIVGNGPSLDNLIPILKEERDKAIIVSCGTALQSLHRNGIVPDYHTEIEINRSTYDWAMRINDTDYLKQIDFISCNGVHPDTARLYRKTLLAFKEGESATVSITELYPKHDFCLLSTSYPTVSNFALNLFTKIGFKQLYLFGIDMGYVDVKYHHSKSSGYYKNSGEELYDYALSNDSSLIIPGNFRPTVKTKYEFKVSKTVLEQTLHSTDAQVYNLNDGAKIVGATPLHGEEVLILNTPELKQNVKQWMEKDAFIPVDLETFNATFSHRYQHEALVNEMSELAEIIHQPIVTRSDAERLVEQQRDFLVTSYRRQKSLLFYYLNGTMNYINSAFNKLLHFSDDDTCLDAYRKVHDYWATTFDDILQILHYDPDGFDFIPSLIRQRQQIVISNYITKNSLRFFSANVDQQALLTLTMEHYNLVVADATPTNTQSIEFVDTSTKLEMNNGQRRSLVIKDITIFKEFLAQLDNADIAVFLPGDFEQERYSVVCNDIYRCFVAILASISDINIEFVLPKVSIDFVGQSVSDYYDVAMFSHYYAYECYDFVAFSRVRLSEAQRVTGAGDKLRFIPSLRPEHLVVAELNLQQQAEEKQKIRQIVGRG